MKIQITSDEVNILLHRYLLENGFIHTAFLFYNEAAINKNPFWQSHAEKLPPNALISFLQKAMLFIYIEYHTNDDSGEAIRCDEPFSLFRRHECWSYGEKNGEGEEDALLTPKLPPTVENLSNGTPLNEENHTSTLTSTSSHAKRSTSKAAKFEKSKKRMKSGRLDTGGEEEDAFLVDTEATEGGELESLALSNNSTTKVHNKVERGEEDSSLTDDVLPLLTTPLEDSAFQLVEEDAASLYPPPFAYMQEEGPTLNFEDFADDTEGDIFVGRPAQEEGEKIKLQTYARLLESNVISSEAGALSEWSPTDSTLIVTNFAADNPHLHRLPSSMEGITLVPPLRTLQGPPLDTGEINPGSSSCWKHDGSYLATGYESGHVCVWDKEGHQFALLHASSTSVVCLAFSLKGTYLAAGTADGTICVWNIKATEKERPTLREDVLSGGSLLTPPPPLSYGHYGGVIDIAWKNDEILASGSIDKSIILCDVTLTDKRISLYQQSEIAGLCWNTQGDFLAIVDDSPVVTIWKSDQRVEDPLLTLEGHQETVIKAEWLKPLETPETFSLCSVLITVSMDKHLIMWNVEQASILKIFTYYQPPTALRVSPSGAYLAVCTYDCALRIYKLPQLELCNTFIDKTVKLHTTWSCDDQRIAYNVFNSGRTIVINL